MQAKHPYSLQLSSTIDQIIKLLLRNGADKNVTPDASEETLDAAANRIMTDSRILRLPKKRLGLPQV